MDASWQHASTINAATGSVVIENTQLSPSIWHQQRPRYTKLHKCVRLLFFSSNNNNKKKVAKPHHYFSPSTNSPAEPTTWDHNSLISSDLMWRSAGQEWDAASVATHSARSWPRSAGKLIDHYACSSQRGAGIADMRTIPIIGRRQQKPNKWHSSRGRGRKKK